MSLLAWIALAGAAGAVARYGLSGWVQSLSPGSFPWGTLAVNVLGCFLLGFALRVLQLSALSPAVRGAVTVGFLGAFTTFSTFSFEAVGLLQEGRWTRAAAYVGGSVALGLAAVLAGLWLAAALQRPPAGP
ncbi:MAG: fluoride efflux transporter CrcB [Gemmatimonadota bacterium]|nr:fluoride efflux transporter CrcB [Gemmatimonadota bacterium]